MKLEHGLIELSYKHRGTRSYSTRARERSELRQMAKVLHAGGFTALQNPKDLKGRHRDFLVSVWKGERQNPLTGETKALAPSVQAVYTSTLRKWSRWVGKPALVAKSNRNMQLNLDTRERIRTKNIAWRLPEQESPHVREHVWLALRGQQEFGLRCKEAFLMEPERQHIRVDPGEKVQVLGKDLEPGEYLLVERGTKGGRERVVPVRTKSQREWLREVKVFAKSTAEGNLVVGGSLKQSLINYDSDMRRAGYRNGHGLRHGYGQDRYRELTGFHCPLEGGPSQKELNAEDRALDEAARRVVAEELGHGSARWQQATAQYLGK